MSKQDAEPLEAKVQALETQVAEQRAAPDPRLVALLEQWRASAKKWQDLAEPNQDFADGHESALTDCADELARLLGTPADETTKDA